MKRRTGIILIGALLGCLASCAVLFQVVVYGCCLWECLPPRPFKVLELELPDNLYPSGAIINQLYPLSEGEGAVEDGNKTVYWLQGAGGRAIYDVWRFASIRQAREAFSQEQKSFSENGTKTPWHRPAELTFLSPTADDFFIGCGKWSEYRCGLAARYAEYVISFNAVIAREMPYAQFEKIVRFIDNQISTRLYP